MQEVIPKELIEKALTLTGKSEFEMIELTLWYNDWDKIITKWKFCIEKFCYYLLSPEFIEKYDSIIYPESSSPVPYLQSLRFWQAIYEYQTWNTQPFIDLLSKI